MAESTNEPTRINKRAYLEEKLLGWSRYLERMRTYHECSTHKEIPETFRGINLL